MSRTLERLPLLDVLRGYALVCIMVDHMPESVVSHGTLSKLAFFDAAELFVVLAGFLVGAVWSKLEEKQGAAAAQSRFLRRSGEVYRAYFSVAIVMALLSATLFAIGLEHVAIWPGYGEALIETPHLYLIETASFWSTPNLVDVLALYVVLLAASWFAMPLLRSQPVAFIAVSLSLWLAAEPLNSLIPSGRQDGGFVFNPFGWQLLFFGGALISTYRHELDAALAPYAAAITALAVTITLGGLFYAVGREWEAIGDTRLWEDYRSLFGDIDKWRLDEVRVVGVLAAVWLIGLIPRDIAGRIAATRAGAALSAVGRKGLPCFSIGVILTVLGDAVGRALAPALGGWPAYLLMDALCIAALLLAARALEKGADDALWDWLKGVAATALAKRPAASPIPVSAEAARPPSSGRASRSGAPDAASLRLSPPPAAARR